MVSCSIDRGSVLCLSCSDQRSTFLRCYLSLASLLLCLQAVLLHFLSPGPPNNYFHRPSSCCMMSLLNERGLLLLLLQRFPLDWLSSGTYSFSHLLPSLHHFFQSLDFISLSLSVSPSISFSLSLFKPSPPLSVSALIVTVISRAELLPSPHLCSLIHLRSYQMYSRNSMSTRRNFWQTLTRLRPRPKSPWPVG